ncbi:MAG TPA: hypothetical protein VN861_19440 [Candidatus Acidoferrales bacterium]|nr:hypothetical protein [Candidatus Acidoferrales bacterium]
MNNSLRLTFLALVALAGLATIVSAEQNLPEGSSRREQTHFSIEENPEHVVTLPEAVLDLLTNDETVVQEKSCVKKNGESSGNEVLVVRGFRGSFGQD